MKKNNLLFCALASFGLFAAQQASAQTPFATSENLDINHFNAAHMVHGDMWWNPATVQPSCEYPKGSGKHANYLGALWMGGFDGSGTLKGATTMYQSVIDFWPGPLDASGTSTHANAKDWAKIWKVEASTIGEFRTLYAASGAAAVAAAKFDVIKQWPAVGNKDALGATGTPLSQLLSPLDVNGYAPFVDANGDNLYNWKDGDYPKIKGDQMLWWVINDNTDIHGVSEAPAIGVEVQVSAYAYNRGSAVDRMMFYEYMIINRSSSTLDSFVISMFSEADLGFHENDALAIDSNKRMVVEFNTDSEYVYGINPPLTALSFVEVPGDIYPSAMQKIGGFTYFDHTGSGPYREPTNMTSFYRYMTGSDANGFPFNYFPGGTRYFYNFNSTWSPCDSSTYNYDRQFIISTRPFSFPSKSAKKLGMVFMATDTNGHICPSLKLNEIADLADTAWKVYWNPLPLSAKQINIAAKGFELFPNPAESILYLTTKNTINPKATVRIIDALGRTMNLPIVQSNIGYEISISSLSSGLYSVVYNDGEKVSSQTFIKN